MDMSDALCDSHYRRIEPGVYDVYVGDAVIGRVVRVRQRCWMAVCLDDYRVGSLETHSHRNWARYELVNSPEGRAAWDGES